MAVLAEILPSIVAETEVASIGGVYLHPTPCAPVALGQQIFLQVPEEWRQNSRVIVKIAVGHRSDFEQLTKGLHKMQCGQSCCPNNESGLHELVRRVVATPCPYVLLAGSTLAHASARVQTTSSKKEVSSKRGRGGKRATEIVANEWGER